MRLIARLSGLFLFIFCMDVYVKAQTAVLPQEDIKEGFKNPPITARPKALWPWVNGNFSLSRITHELEEAKTKGMGGFDIWDVGTSVNPGNIVPAGPPFLGDESLDGIAHAIWEAGRLGLELGLISSSSWNAGGSWIKPEFGAMGLFKRDTIVNGPLVFKGRIPFPEIPDNYGSRKTLVARNADGLPVFYKEVAYVAHPIRSDSSIKKEEILFLEKNPGDKEDLTLNIPKGRWRIVRYVCAPTGQPLMVPSPKSNGLMLDHFSAAAQEANMAYIIGRLKSKFGSLNQTALKYLYEDSYEVNTAVWTPDLPTFFEKKTGYDLRKYLPALDGFTIQSEDFTSRFRFDFDKMLSDLIIENHYAKGREICEREGIGFYAEAGGPGKPIHNVPFEDLKALGALTIPRGEFWNKHPQLEKLQIVKGIASAAHIYNQKAVEAEAFTSVWLWQEGPCALKPLADRAMSEGLNRFVYHTFPHTTPEAGKPGWIYNFGTLINTTNGWWPKSEGFHHYLARCSYILQQGNFKGDVAFYYGDEAPKFVAPKHVPAALGKGYDYDVVNTDVILNKMKVENGKIVLPHGQSYEVLVLPDDDRINPEVLKKIERMVSMGATVVGKRPVRSYSLSDFGQQDKEVKDIAGKLWSRSGLEKKYGNGKMVWGKSVRTVLLEKGIQPDVQVKSKVSHDSLDFIHRYTESMDFYFIRNVSAKDFIGTATFRISHRQPEWWNPVNGNTSKIQVFQEENGSTTIPLYLKGNESLFVVFRKNEADRSLSAMDNLYNTSYGIRNLSESKAITISTPWNVRFENNGNTPTEMNMPELKSWHTSSHEAIRYFSGAAAYNNRFTITKEQLQSGNTILLELNDVIEVADVFLNGDKLGNHWHKSQVFDITRNVKEGDNVLTIEVVNSINNALIGDAKRPEQFRVYKSNITKLPNAWSTPFADASLLKAGLIGPVVIKIVKGVK